MEWEKPLEAAKRELLEETGNASTTNNFTHSFIARGVKKISSQHLDRTEDIEPILMNAEQVKELLVSDKIKQSLMAAPMWKFFATEGLL
ncbi:MAG: NUDIX hydrolase [Bacteroidales bacterium]|nr:NUDIX hydrolase [Bacteroidales bacterium]